MEILKDFKQWNEWRKPVFNGSSRDSIEIGFTGLIIEDKLLQLVKLTKE
jgi:hypothetical protein